VSGGGLFPDPDLADFGWETSVRPAGAVTAAFSNEKCTAGLRLSRAVTSQSIGDLPGEPAKADVRLSQAVAAAELDILRLSGFDLRTLASLGFLHLGYSPDRVAFAAPLEGSDSLSVELDSITEPTAGFGLAVGRALGRHFEVDLRGERSWFRLDTSHRKGEEIVSERRAFGLWTIALSLSRSHTFGGMP
jgi:hypothetical protein